MAFTGSSDHNGKYTNDNDSQTDSFHSALSEFDCHNVSMEEDSMFDDVLYHAIIPEDEENMYNHANCNIIMQKYDEAIRLKTSSERMKIGKSSRCSSFFSLNSGLDTTLGSSYMLSVGDEMDDDDLSLSSGTTQSDLGDDRTVLMELERKNPQLFRPTQFSGSDDVKRKQFQDHDCGKEHYAFGSDTGIGTYRTPTRSEQGSEASEQEAINISMSSLSTNSADVENYVDNTIAWVY